MLFCFFFSVCKSRKGAALSWICSLCSTDSFFFFKKSSYFASHQHINSRVCLCMFGKKWIVSQWLRICRIQGPDQPPPAASGGGAPAWSGILDFRAEWNQTGFCQKGVEVEMGGVGGVNRQRVAGLALGAPQLIHTDGKH